MNPSMNNVQAFIDFSIRLDEMEATRGEVCAVEYQYVVAQIKRSLSMGLPSYVVQPVIDAHPATAQIDENLVYARSGLASAPLQMAIGSAIVTIELLERLRRKTSLKQVN